MYRHQVGVHALELGVLILQIAQLSLLRNAHASVLALQLVVRRDARIWLSRNLDVFMLRLRWLDFSIPAWHKFSRWLHFRSGVALSC
jgi:hypothetical protein